MPTTADAVLAAIPRFFSQRLYNPLMRIPLLLALLTPISALAQDATLRRLDTNPILRPDMIPHDDGEWSGNLNFPSVIRAPDWLPNRLGNYYCYFSAHHGSYIRLAYADRIEGPWKIYEPGTLRIEQVEAANAVTEKIADRHVASPDVHIDNDQKQIRMYFHFLLPKLGHKSSVAFSKDGLKFEPKPGIIAGPYLRVFRKDNAYWSLDDRGLLSTSPDGIEPFKPISEAVKRVANDSAKRATFRHGGVLLNADSLAVFYSRIGDAPERLFVTRVKMTGDPATWVATEPTELLRPERDWEGTTFADIPSTFRGQTNVRQLRDPSPFVDGARTLLFYSIAGETGIAVGELTLDGR